MVGIGKAFIQRRPALRNRLGRLRHRAPHLRVATLKPKGPARGHALISFVLEPFLHPGYAAMTNHTAPWEAFEMGKALTELGYEVDAISWRNTLFEPEKPYDLVIDTRVNIERLHHKLKPDCLKIMHIEMAHWLFHTTAQLRRLRDLQSRRGVVLAPRKPIQPNRNFEAADCATILGNDFTCGTYAFADKPLYRLPISSPCLYDWPKGKDIEPCRRNFVWFGSDGLVHKGLDLTLEAFAGMPDFHLTVCGPVSGEPDFEKAYSRELYETPSISTLGWLDVASQRFMDVMNDSLALVYPSCSEGQCGAAITCHHAGLIPMLSEQSGIDVPPERGVRFQNCSVEEIRGKVRELSARPADELRNMARMAYNYARENHTRPVFAEHCREALQRLLADVGKRS